MKMVPAASFASHFVVKRAAVFVAVACGRISSVESNFRVEIGLCITSFESSCYRPDTGDALDPCGGEDLDELLSNGLCHRCSPSSSRRPRLHAFASEAGIRHDHL
jgi:hypothetical protein